MKSTEDLRVEGYQPLMTPAALNKELPITETVNRTVITARESIQNILAGRDRRMMAIVGPCSIHDKKAAYDYAGRLAEIGPTAPGFGSFRQNADRLRVWFRIT